MPNARRDVATAMADAARAWLDLLAEDQLATATWPFPADQERRLWFYTPTDHGGLTLGAMDPAQQRGAMRLLRTGLSEAAYNTATTIIGLENVLDAVEHWRSTFGRQRGRDPGMYFVRVFGQPGPVASWGWRFGGHHVSVNHTVVDGELASSTPCFLGADPAHSPLLGPHLLRPLGGAEDLGRELVRSLDAGQFDRALVSPVAPVDLVTANRARVTDGDRPLPLQSIFRGALAGPMHEQMARGQARMEDAIGLRPDHVDALSLTPRRRAYPPPSWAASSASCCASCSTCTSGESPTSSPTRSPPSTPATPTSTHCRSPGPAASSRTSRTTTGCRVPACSPSTTTPSAVSTTSTRCGGTSTLTSAGMPSPTTTPTPITD